METLPSNSPDIHELERLIEANSAERQQLFDKETALRLELREIIRQKLPSLPFDTIRDKEREARAEITQNLEQYDVLVEKWAAEGTRP